MLRKKLILITILLFSLISVSYAIQSFPFDCVYEESDQPLQTGFQKLFSTSAEISSHVSTSQNFYYNSNKGWQIRCNAATTKGGVDFTIKDKPTTALVCDGDEQEIMYFTDTENARVAREYIQGFHTKVLCAKFQKSNGVMHIVWNNQNFAERNYECLFRTNDVKNGLVSSCDQTFDSNKKYRYTVWGMLFDSIDSLNCKSDCSSKVDDRIYSICSAKIKSCSDVPLDCDGSLLGSWVNYNSTHEIQCSGPWNNFRSKVFSTEKVEVTSVDGACEDLIKIEYPVIYNDEQVVMNIYVCNSN